MAAAAAVVWLTAAVRKVLTGSVPGLLLISGLVLTLQAVLVLATGSVLLFLLQFPLANLAMCILFARTAPTGRPLVAQLAAEVVALRQPSAAHPGLDSFFRRVTWLWAGIFAASTIGLAALLALEPTTVFLLLTTVVTVVGVAAGTALSVLWFIRMLRRCGLRVRFGQVLRRPHDRGISRLRHPRQGAGVLDNIESSEHVYHRGDPAAAIRQALASARDGT
jgi:uncharacterized membrane protein